MTDIIVLYHQYILDRYTSLLNSGKAEFDNKDLSKIFEYYTAIQLYKQYGRLFYEYNDINPDFKELNQMSKNDSGIDLCDLVDTIVQCKLRSKSLTWGECSTFFASQNIFNEETNLTIIRWQKLILARNTECSLSSNLSIKNKLFNDVAYNKDELLEFCSSLLLQEKETCIKPKEDIILRDYQKECIELIKNSDKNVIIQLPTGCGKNVIITKYISHCIDIANSKCDDENTKPLKYLILVPKIILMEQIRDEFVALNLACILDNIQLIGDGNAELNDKLITICVYNSIDKIDDFTQFEKIFIDEAHHIIKPEIYYNEDDTNSEYNSDDDEYPSDIDDINSECNSDDEDHNSENGDIEEDECNVEEIKEPPKENYLTKIRKLKKYNNNVFLSATIDKIDGYEYYSKDIRDMINAGYLCDYNIHIPIFSGNIDTIKNDINVCKHIIQNYQNIIIYCNTKEEGIEINRIINDLLPLCSNYVDCDTKRNERKTILDRFKSGEVPFLVNVKILVEGVNFPITKGVLFLHLPSSKTAIIQIIGRALRLHDYKTIANIILPFSNTEDEKDINNFLRILANNDYRIKQSYDKKKLGGYISLNKVEEDCSEEVNGENNCEFRFTMIYDNIGKLVNSEGIWMQKLEDVQNYINKFEKRPSESDTNIYIKSLGKWVTYQIAIYNNKANGVKSINRYNIWTNFINNYKQYLFTRMDSWLQKLKSVEMYINAFKRRPNKSSNHKDEKAIGEWLHSSIENYKKNKGIMKNIDIKKHMETFMKMYGYKLLSNKEKFMENLVTVKEYIHSFKICPNKRSKNKEEKIIGEWLHNTVQNYKKNRHGMKNEHIRKIWKYFINDEKYKQYFN